MLINRKYLLVLAGALLAMPVNLCAQGKIGLLNVLHVMAECAEGKQALGEFNKKVDAKRVELEKKSGEIQELQRQLQSQSRTLNDESRAALAKNIENKTTELQRSQDDAQKEFTQTQNEIMNRIGNRMAPIVQKYAKDNNFTIIVDGSNQNSQVIYFDPAIEITAEIIRKVDSSPTTAAAPAAVAPAVPATPAATVPPAANKPK